MAQVDQQHKEIPAALPDTVLQVVLIQTAVAARERLAAPMAVAQVVMADITPSLLAAHPLVGLPEAGQLMGAQRLLAKVAVDIETK
jgi:hypothetical protein